MIFPGAVSVRHLGWAGATASLAAWALWFFGLRRVSWALLLSVAALSGQISTQDARSHGGPPGDPPPGLAEGPQTFQGTVASWPSRRPGGSSFTVDLESRLEGAALKGLAGRARVFAAGEEAPERGDVIRFRASLTSPRNFGNEGEWDAENYYRTRTIAYLGTIARRGDWLRVRPAEGFFRKALNRIRGGGIDRAEIYFDSGRAAVFRSLVLGDQAGLSPEQTEAFRNAGILHLLVVSGSHVVLVAWLGSLLASFLHRRSRRLIHAVPIWRTRSLGALAAALLFCFLTDLPVPTSRALWAVLLAFVFLNLSRRPDVLGILLATAFVILIAQPLYLFDVSAQLTFAAVLGILAILGVIGPPKTRTGLWGRAGTYLLLLGETTLGATLFTLPVLAAHFHQLSLWTFLGNFLFIPTIGGLGTSLGLAGALLGGPFSVAGNYLFCVLDQFFAWLLPIVHWVANLPGSEIWVKLPSPGVIWGYILLGLSLHAVRMRIVRGVTGSVCAALGAAAMVLPYLFSAGPSGEIRFLSVGQGEAALLRSGDRLALIDAGPTGPHWDAGERVVVPYLRALGRKRVDLLILTHGDLDHTGGAGAVLREASVGEVWMPAGPSNPWLEDLRTLCGARGIPWRSVSSRTLPVKLGRFRLSFLHPPPGFSGMAHNVHSLVLKVAHEEGTALFTGDLEAEGERQLVLSGADFKTDVLKVAHHGSKTSTTPGFLAAVRPWGAMVGAGFRNRYRHPSPVVLERLRTAGVRTWRTDLCGEVRVAFAPAAGLSFSTGRTCQKNN